MSQSTPLLVPAKSVMVADLGSGTLYAQLAAITDIMDGVKRGDLSQKVTGEVQPELRQLKSTINAMVDNLRVFADEVTRVAAEVGTEGKLGGQAIIPGVSGIWRDLTDRVNAMATNLTLQVRSIAKVSSAVARGDLGRKITIEVKGEILLLKDTINTMVDQLNSFASEVTRVAREVGTDGRLGGQANVSGVSGTWKDLTDSVNAMAANLTGQVRNIAIVVTAISLGDLSKKLTVEAKGEVGELADTINDMIGTLSTFSEQVTAVAREVGTDGKLGGQARVPGATGLWKDLTDSVNRLAENLTAQVRSIGEVATAVAAGDLTRAVEVEALGEVAELKTNVNRMISALREARGGLESKARQADTASGYKSAFLANMSHELRTPINSIIVLSKMLAEGKGIPAEFIEHAQTIDAAATDLLSLVNDVLDLAKTEAGVVRIDKAPCDVALLVKFAVDTFGPVFRSKNLTFTTSMETDAPATLHTDERRLRQILKNLLSNATKFTERGGATLTVEAVGNLVAFVVADTGIGIPADKLNVIFETFQQVEEGATARQYGGTGLGLSISRELAGLLGGNITVASVLGKGSTFTLFLPK